MALREEQEAGLDDIDIQAAKEGEHLRRGQKLQRTHREIIGMAGSKAGGRFAQYQKFPGRTSRGSGVKSTNRPGNFDRVSSDKYR